MVLVETDYPKVAFACALGQGSKAQHTLHHPTKAHFPNHVPKVLWAICWRALRYQGYKTRTGKVTCGTSDDMMQYELSLRKYLSLIISDVR